VCSSLGPTLLSAVVANAATLIGAGCTLDVPAHFLEQFKALEACERLVGFSPERRIIVEALKRRPEPQRAHIIALLAAAGIRGVTPGDRLPYFFTRALHKSRAWLRTLASAAPALERLKSLVRPTLRDPGHPDGAIVDGAAYGVSNIYEAARAYEEIATRLYGDRQFPKSAEKQPQGEQVH